MFLLALALALAGCSPSGPRALLKGKKQLERGNYDAAVAQLKIATSLLSSNAQAWNYLGVACQHAGHPTEAAAAYQRALAHDRDLMEAHYNLGCLWLEQNKPDAAASEFITYTLRRSKAPEGWLKLGLAQLQSHDVTAAEKSFSTALYLSPDSAEALNGLGLARVERGRPNDALQFFTAATKNNPDYAPAWLNLGTVALQQLHDTALALTNYHAFLALKPRPANWEEVNDLVSALESPAKTSAANETQPPSAESRLAAAASAARPAPMQRTQTVARVSTVAPRQATPPPPTVRTQPEPAVARIPAAEAPTEPAATHTSTFSRLNPLNWFRSAAPETNQVLVITSAPPPVVRNTRVAITPLAPANPPTPAPTPAAIAPRPTPVAPATPAPAVPAKPVRIAQPAAPTYPRYVYLSPPKPAPGDRRAAAAAFARARELEQASRWQEALQAYREATTLDPSWFEAQYNYGVIAHRLQNYSQALAAYETALAIQPESVNARYNFALALKAQGYTTDAVNELEKLLVTNPNEVRAHLALGNIYARQLYDPARARQHYQRVVQLDPGNAQAPEIHFWLSSNPD